MRTIPPLAPTLIPATWLLGLLVLCAWGQPLAAQLPESRFLVEHRSSFRPQAGKRNPFLPVDYVPVGRRGQRAPVSGSTMALRKEAFRLSGILLDEKAPLAVINGRSYTLGDKIEYDAGAGIQLLVTVVDIQDREVYLTCQDMKLTLTMGGGAARD